MAWAAVAAAAIMAGGSLYSSSQQQGAAKDAQGTQLGMFNQIRNDLAPYNMAGQGAVNALSSYWGLPQGGGMGGSYGGGLTPGMTAAQGSGKYSTNGSSLNGIGGDIVTGGLFRHNASPIQDIQAAMQLGRPITDAQWAQAGYGPGGSGGPGGAQGGLPTVPMGQANPVAGGMQGPGSPTASSASNAFQMLSQYPGYQFQYGQGLEAMNRNLSAGGRYMSGAMLKDSQAYGQGFAQNSVTNYLDMLKFLGSLGENSAAQTGAFGTQAGAGIAGSQMAGGTAAAAGTMGAANGVGGLFQNQNFQSLFGGNNYSNAGGGMYNGSYLAPFNSAAAGMGY